MRVLIDYRPALRQRSGAGEYIHQLVRALLSAFPPDGGRSRLDLSVFSSSWKDRFEPGDELSGATAIDRRVPVRLLNLAWHRLGRPSIERLTGGAYDVAHSPHPLLIPSRDAARVITIHDLNFLTHPERTRAEIRRDYVPLARDHARRADHVIVPSRFTAGEVERLLNVPAAHISICAPGAPAWTARSAPPADGGYVLFFSTLEPRKNVGALLDAYEQLLTGPAAARPTMRVKLPVLILAGRATDAARPWLERIGRAPLNTVVRHIGYVDPANRRPLYEGARLLVQPSFEEGFGLPVLEAMTLGVPVVAAARGSLPEVLGDAGALVEPEPVPLAAAIQRMLDDGAYAAACAAKGVLRARQFDWGQTARHVYEAYELAIAHHRGHSVG